MQPAIGGDGAVCGASDSTTPSTMIMFRSNQHASPEVRLCEPRGSNRINDPRGSQSLTSGLLGRRLGELMQKPANNQHPIHDLLRQRWSPRAFDPRSIEPGKLQSLFEAARWAPSSYN